MNASQQQVKGIRQNKWQQHPSDYRARANKMQYWRNMKTRKQTNVRVELRWKAAFRLSLLGCSHIKDLGSYMRPYLLLAWASASHTSLSAELGSEIQKPQLLIGTRWSMFQMLREFINSRQSVTSSIPRKMWPENQPQNAPLEPPDLMRVWS